MKFEDIMNGFLFVSMGPPFEHQAILCKETGKVYYTSEDGDSDELPADSEDSDKYIEIPHKNDLDLGRALVMDFVTEYLPAALREVDGIFRHKGAYVRFKELLGNKGILEEWQAYEEKKQAEALRQWCEEQGIEITG